ncbi:hypothetical protein VP01_2468g1 [Puccinia sorghi]|uniref:Uncharacterized protein n=1 Tax=Puccinia sorghi TaxID=27349 RepID=A0A0L6V5Y6_9BASI|nr:hypothetical protein VP01_2468g1 [Puccinia sorghi]
MSLLLLFSLSSPSIIIDLFFIFNYLDQSMITCHQRRRIRVQTLRGCTHLLNGFRTLQALIQKLVQLYHLLCTLCEFTYLLACTHSPLIRKMSDLAQDKFGENKLWHLYNAQNLILFLGLAGLRPFKNLILKGLFHEKELHVVHWLLFSIGSSLALHWFLFSIMEILSFGQDKLKYFYVLVVDSSPQFHSNATPLFLTQTLYLSCILSINPFLILLLSLYNWSRYNLIFPSSLPSSSEPLSLTPTFMVALKNYSPRESAFLSSMKFSSFRYSMLRFQTNVHAGKEHMATILKHTVNATVLPMRHDFLRSTMSCTPHHLQQRALCVVVRGSLGLMTSCPRHASIPFYAKTDQRSLCGSNLSPTFLRYVCDVVISAPGKLHKFSFKGNIILGSSWFCFLCRKDHSWVQNQPSRPIRSCSEYSYGGRRSRLDALSWRLEVAEDGWGCSYLEAKCSHKGPIRQGRLSRRGVTKMTKQKTDMAYKPGSLTAPWRERRRNLKTSLIPSHPLDYH